MAIHVGQGNGNGSDHDAARVAEIKKEAQYERGLFGGAAGSGGAADEEEEEEDAEGEDGGKNGTATGQGLGPIGEGAAGSAGAGRAGGLAACCASYWKGYTTGYTLVGVGLLVMALSALIRARFDKMYLAKLQDKLSVSSLEEVRARAPCRAVVCAYACYL